MACIRRSRRKELVGRRGENSKGHWRDVVEWCSGRNEDPHKRTRWHSRQGSPSDLQADELGGESKRERRSEGGPSGECAAEPRREEHGPTKANAAEMADAAAAAAITINP
eukprot:3168071-Pleurochrysis_carterae.AAC.2